MTRFAILFCGFAAVAAFTAASIGLAETPATTADPVAANAALFYWRAFALLPTLDEKQNKLVQDVLDMKPVEEELGSVVKWSASPLRELHRGAKQPRCVWALAHEDGIGMLLPHAGKARELARIAVVRARWNFSHGKSAEGVDDLIDAMCLARGVGSDPILMTLFVDYAIESMVQNAAATEMNRMGPVELKQFAEQLKRLPPATTIRQAVLGDRDIFLESLINNLSKADGKEKVFAQYGISDSNDPFVRALKEMSRERILEGAVGARPFYEKLATLMETPPSEINGINEKVAAALADPHVKEMTRIIIKANMSPFIPAKQSEVRQQIRLALLQAAIAVQQQGPEALSNPVYHDPFAKAAFQYDKVNGEFRLQSKTPNPRTGKPITLEVGKGLSE